MRGRALALIVALAALVASASEAAASVRLGEVERADGKLSFTLFVPGGGPKLSPGRVDVTVNGLRAADVDAAPLAAEAQPRGVALVVDTSGSMKGAPIAEAKQALTTFVSAVEPTDRVALVAFSDDVTVLSGFTNDRDQLDRAVSELTASGETALHDGVLRAVALIEGLPPEQRNIVVLSDGADTASIAPLSRAAAAAREAGATLSVVALESPEFSAAAVRKLAASTGGEVVRTTDPSRLSALFEGLARELVVGYRITVPDPDPAATVAQIDVGLRLAGKRVESTRTFALPGGTPTAAPASAPLSPVPLALLLVVVFLAVAGLAFIASEAIRRKRTSPVDRIDWYERAAAGDVDSEALINAAVLERAKALATALAHRAGYVTRIERKVETAGMRWRAGELIVASVGLGIAAFVLGIAGWSFLTACLAAVVGLIAPTAFINYKAARRRAAFYEQLPEVLILMSGALRAGYSLQQAVAAVGEDAKPPAADEFRRAMAEVRLGASLDDALHALARRLEIVDFEWTVLAIQIQREVGGNLAEILEIIGDTIRERERLRRQIKALTAEGRLSAWILGLLPFAMAALLTARAPDYLEPLYKTTLGLIMVGGSLLMMGIGVVWMRKIIKIEV